MILVIKPVPLLQGILHEAGHLFNCDIGLDVVAGRIQDLQEGIDIPCPQDLGNHGFDNHLLVLLTGKVTA